MLEIEAEANGGEEAFGLPHRTQRRIGIDRSRPPPFKKVCHPSVECRTQQGMRLSDLIAILKAAPFANRVIEQVWRRQTGQRPHVPKMGAEQSVEFLFV